MSKHLKEIIKEAKQIARGNVDPQEYGWVYIGAGAEKLVWKKGNLVLKIGNCYSSQVTIRVLKRHRLLKYYAKTYYISRKCMIQEYLPKRASIKNEELIQDEISDKLWYKGYLIDDLYFGNIMQTKDNIPKIIDCFISRNRYLSKRGMI